jgi:hypothetical protein
MTALPELAAVTIRALIENFIKFTHRYIAESEAKVGVPRDLNASVLPVIVAL